MMDTHIRADFTQRAGAQPIMDGALVGSDWLPSPLAGVERFPLDRIGGEVARATSLVRYAPGSVFSSHTHDQGEEYLVLEGTFGDEHGLYPTGTYVRNPPGSAHSPRCPDGCVILVKLRQMSSAESERRVVEAGDGDQVLFESRVERVERVALGERETLQLPLLEALSGCELLVIRGAIEVDGEPIGRWGWVRFPPKDLAQLRALEPSVVWIKSGGEPYIKEA